MKKIPLAEIIQKIFAYSGKSSLVIEGKERIYGIGYDVIIQTKVPFETFKTSKKFLKPGKVKFNITQVMGGGHK